MQKDAIIKQQIEKALDSNAMLNGTVITVAVQKGNAVLTGTADKYHKKDLARKIAKEVQGVLQVNESIHIVLDNTDKRSDDEITNDIIEKFRKNFGSSHKDINIIIREGHVWLEGRLKWKYQKDLAQECIVDTVGITGIENNILIPETRETLINEKDVFAAIYGDPTITTDIKIEIIGNRVVLKGKVNSAEQKNLVTRLVRNVYGVKEIENFLTIYRSLQ